MPIRDFMPQGVSLVNAATLWRKGVSCQCRNFMAQGGLLSMPQLYGAGRSLVDVRDFMEHGPPCSPLLARLSQSLTRQCLYVILTLLGVTAIGRQAPPETRPCHRLSVPLFPVS